jgi:hypothetical protein
MTHTEYALVVKKETLERLLNKIDAIFNEIKYSERIDDEIRMSADDEAQDFDTFGEHKI